MKPITFQQFENPQNKHQNICWICGVKKPKNSIFWFYLRQYKKRKEGLCPKCFNKVIKGERNRLKAIKEL